MDIFSGFAAEGEEETYLYPTMQTDGVNTATSRQQLECERMCELNFLPLRPGALEEGDMAEFREEGSINADGKAVLMRAKHQAYLMRGLSGLGPGFIPLDASRPWIVYWILHSLDLLDAFPEGNMPQRIIETIDSCQDPINGGFGGGPKQLPHCAPMYASVLSLLIIGTPAAYSVVDRHALYRLFLSLKHACGGFRMHDDGEVDARGTYTVIAVASLLNMLTPELAEGVAEFIVRCQTFEGGFGGEPWSEAHGGYTFCAFASLVILGACHKTDLTALRRWLCGRQMRAEGGFQGRTNKLVDGCYSFWQGGAVAMLDYVEAGRASEVSHRDAEGRLVTPQDHLSSNTSVRRQGAEEGQGGGKAIRDSGDDDGSGGGGGGGAAVVAQRAEVVENLTAENAETSTEAENTETPKEARAVEHPTEVEDVVLLGAGGDGEGLDFARERLQEYVLMCSQQSDGGLRDKPGKGRDFYHTCYTLSGLSVAQHCLADSPIVVGDSSNKLKRTNPVYNIVEDRVGKAMAYFELLPSDHETLLAEAN